MPDNSLAWNKGPCIFANESRTADSNKFETARIKRIQQGIHLFVTLTVSLHIELFPVAWLEA